MSEENWKKMDLKFENLQKTIVAALKPKAQVGSGKEEPHKTLIATMECPNCTPAEKYRAAHLKLMNQKECKHGECHNVDRVGEEYCSECGEEY